MIRPLALSVPQRKRAVFVPRTARKLTTSQSMVGGVALRRIHAPDLADRRLTAYV